VLGALCGRFQGGFHFGLPEAFFEISLLWTSAYDARRISGPADKTQRLSQLLSWSWTGWGWCCRHVHVLTHTSLSPFRLEGTLSQVPRLRMRQLVPQYKKRLNSESRAPISNSFYKWKGFSKNPSAKVPGGWHRGSPNCLGGRRYTKTWEAMGKTYTRQPSIICCSAWNSLGLHLSQHGAFSQGRE
jgi:hypothetical protein